MSSIDHGEVRKMATDTPNTTDEPYGWQQCSMGLGMMLIGTVATLGEWRWSGGWLSGAGLMLWAHAANWTCTKRLCRRLMS